MTNRWMKGTLVALLAAGTVGVALAHHSFSAEFDSAKKLKFTGIVTKVQWRNPHTYFFIDVQDEDGQIHNWAMELGSPNVLMRRGWTRDSLKIGDTVTVEGARARDNSYKGNASSVVTADGKRMFNGTAEEQEGDN
jgi:DNA/RNA endonuclease YhcR with UshA esterase domain